jgi:hypothetical protein
MVNNFIVDTKEASYLSANKLHKELSNRVYENMKSEIKTLETFLYKEAIIPKERMLNDKYKIFVKQLLLNNDKLAKQLQDEEVLKNLTKNIEGTRIRKHLLNPTNYIFSREGQGLLYKGKVKEKIERMLSKEEVQMDFQDFIKNVSKTYRSLASLIIA